MHLLRYLFGSTEFFITYKQGYFRVASFLDANWGNNPDNGWSTSSYIVMLSNAPISFKVGLQRLTAQSSMEAELVGAALAMKEEAVFCSNMMLELGFDKRFGSVPLYIDNTSVTVLTFLAQSISHLFDRARTGGGQNQHHLHRHEQGSAGGLGHQVR